MLSLSTNFPLTLPSSPHLTRSLQTKFLADPLIPRTVDTEDPSPGPSTFKSPNDLMLAELSS